MEQYNVTGMSCAACSSRVEKAVSKVPGVTSCSVSLLTNSMVVPCKRAGTLFVYIGEKPGFALSEKGVCTGKGFLFFV